VSRLLGIDYGTVRIGLALSDPTGTLASPLPFLPNQSPQQVTQALSELIQTHQITALIIGLPRNMDGTYGPSAQKVRDFISQIQKYPSSYHPHRRTPHHRPSLKTACGNRPQPEGITQESR